MSRKGEKKKVYHAKTKKMSSRVSVEIIHYDKPPVIDEAFMEIQEQVCAKFGCAKKLSLQEKLCGDLCHKHHLLSELKTKFDLKIYVNP